MGYYFEDQQSMFAAAGFQVERTLETIVRRYVGNNPPHGMTYRAYCERGIRRSPDYRYAMDFGAFYPEAKAEQVVYAWGKYWSDGAATFMADVNCFGPLTVYLNGQVVFRSDLFSERYADKRNRISLPLQAGWNHVVVRAKKTRGGFGGIFGTWLGKHPYYFLMPTPEREGQEGFIFTGPMDADLAPLPGPGMTEESWAGVAWKPERGWTAKQRKMGQFGRLFGQQAEKGAKAVAWTAGMFGSVGKGKYVLKGSHEGGVTVYVDNKEVYRAEGSGKIKADVTAAFGRHEVMVVGAAPKKRESGWGFALSFSGDDGEVAFVSPCAAQGTVDPWLFIGPFEESVKLGLPRLRDLNKVHEAIGGETYWRLDLPDTFLRPYNENALYGRWNYPLGVTLYGLLHSAKVMGSEETEAYIQGHMQSCCDTFDYAMWDKGQYGGATAMHTLLTSIDSLDDCGSFGSALLEVARNRPELKGWRAIADYVADYISNKQARLEDGTFYRKMLMHVFHEQTMWADDLYMSVPFLVRYAAVTGEAKYLDDAARQFLGFKKRLYLPELKIMAHIYDFRREMNTGVPWGRGNGWTIFSLSELLAVLSEKHALRGELVGFFRELCEGYLVLQDEQGMWHQVLTHPDAYPETSCTAMFIYAFARGVQFGWLTEKEPYVKAVMKGWEALNKVSIDRAGNVHGVCRGSEFSFSPEYYKKELLPNLNDTHGIGIVLLAGVEVRRLMEMLGKTTT